MINRQGCHKGRVLRIERASMYDGEGLRTVVFLKGCPLRCLWCSTPESQSPGPERGYLSERCTLCGVCVNACPEKALSIDDAAGRLVINKSCCSGCLVCVKKCPVSAVRGYGRLMTAGQVLREIAKDEIFYYHSGGGVTISGGEPLEQAEFVREILAECRDIGIDRAMETSFVSSWDKIESLIPLLNLIHVDLKNADPAVHKKLTGVCGDIIMQNIKRADESDYDFDLVVRTPIVPGVNDSNEAMELSAQFVKGLRKLKFMEFLAYHRLGTETYRCMGVEYPLKDVDTPSAEYMISKAKLFHSIAGVPVRINGIPL